MERAIDKAMSVDDWITAVLALRKAKRVVVFSGAGMSAESGIPTFRDADGFWEQFPPEDFATWDGLIGKLIAEPRQVARFAWHVIDPIARAEPNAAHRAAAAIEQHTHVTVITQNIDGLHHDAGSSNIWELHGSLLDVINAPERRIVKRFSREDLLAISDAIRCYVQKEQSLVSLIMQLRRHYPFDFRGRHRPNVVLFGDDLAEPDWTFSCREVKSCDVLLSVGTSGSVFPAAFLPGRAELSGATVVSISPTACDGCWLQGNASDVLPRLVKAAWPDANV